MDTGEDTVHWHGFNTIYTGVFKGQIESLDFFFWKLNCCLVQIIQIKRWIIFPWITYHSYLISANNPINYLVLLKKSVNLLNTYEYYLFFCFKDDYYVSCWFLLNSAGNSSEVMSLMCTHTHTHIKTLWSLFRLLHFPGVYHPNWYCLWGWI